MRASATVPLPPTPTTKSCPPRCSRRPGMPRRTRRRAQNVHAWPRPSPTPKWRMQSSTVPRGYSGGSSRNPFGTPRSSIGRSSSSSPRKDGRRDRVALEHPLRIRRNLVELLGKAFSKPVKNHPAALPMALPSSVSALLTPITEYRSLPAREPTSLHQLRTKQGRGLSGLHDAGSPQRPAARQSATDFEADEWIDLVRTSQMNIDGIERAK